MTMLHGHELKWNMVQRFSILGGVLCKILYYMTRSPQLSCVCCLTICEPQYGIRAKMMKKGKTIKTLTLFAIPLWTSQVQL